MENNYHKKILVLTTLSIIFTIIGSTFAYWNWTTNSEEQTLIIFDTDHELVCSADGGGNITSTEKTIMPTTCTDPDKAIQRTITLNTGTPISTNDIFLDLWIDVVNIDEGLANTKNFKYALTKSPNDCETNAVTGSFYKMSEGGRIKVLNKQTYIGTTQDTYYLYIWLDAAETSTDTMNQSFELKLGGKCEDERQLEPYQEPILNGNGPILDEKGMIPVTIDNYGNVKTISMESTDWYSYENKEWANAILVNEASRSNYLNTTDIPVTKSDILAYYVWIPKYSYKMNSSQGTGNESEISISWNYNKTGYVPHPGFAFNGGIKGFWASKFETTGTDTQPTVLNDSPPILNKSISEQFLISLKFANGTFDTTNRTITFKDSDTYGLSSKTDSHMIKNTEWGAVAYLSHSEYGTCTDGVCSEVRLNNYNNNTVLKTGCGAETPETTSSTTTCTLPYGSGISEYPQSTTGNITGVFDMNGGADEYVMGNYNDTISASGFAVLPPTKYYDLYTISSENSCTTEICGGHGFHETKRWYSDYSYFVNSIDQWVLRGGYSDNGKYAGIWYFGRYTGTADIGASWRTVLITQ